MTTDKVKAVIIDIDGTLAHRGKRPIYDFTQCCEDTVDAVTREIIHRFFQDHQILLVTGREERYRDVTVKWLLQHDIAYHRLFMRGTHDYRPGDIVKKEIYEQYIKPTYEVFFVLEDLIHVVKMWKDLGLTCLKVPGEAEAF